MSVGSKMATGALVAAGSGLVAFGLYESAASLVNVFNSVTSPLGQCLVKSAGAAVGIALGSAAGLALGNAIQRKYDPAEAFFCALPYVAAGLVFGAVGGWNAVGHALPPVRGISTPAPLPPAGFMPF